MNSQAIRLLTAVSGLFLCGVARAFPIVFTASLSGPNESPVNASPGIGSATVTLDSAAHTLRVQTSFSGLTGITTASHIHAPTAVAGTGTAGVATLVPAFPGFPLGVTSGTSDSTLDLTLLSSYNPAFVTANGGTAASAEAVLSQAIIDGKSYFNIHSQTFPGGEIRGFLALAPAPTPDTGTTMLMLIFSLAVMFGSRRFQRPSPAISLPHR